jgi:hypothetical protein
VVLVEGPAPQVMDAETEYDHLEGISLLSAGLTPGVEHVTAVVEAPQLRPSTLKSFFFLVPELTKSPGSCPPGASGHGQTSGLFVELLDGAKAAWSMPARTSVLSLFLFLYLSALSIAGQSETSGTHSQKAVPESSEFTPQLTVP